MKKGVLILLIVFLLCVVSSLLLYIFAVVGWTDFTNTLLGKSNVVVLIDRGYVMYKEGEDGKYQYAKDKDKFYTDYWVKTLAGTEAHLLFEDNSVMTLDAETEIDLASIAGKSRGKTTIKQILGNTWHRVTELDGKEYKVELPGAVAAVRGTIFGVNNQEDYGELFSIEDNVDVSTTVTKEDFDLSSDKYLSIGAGNEVDFEVTAIPDGLKADRWFTRNRELDEYLKKIDFENIRNRADLIERYREDRPKRSALDYAVDPESSVEILDTFNSIGSGGSDTCDEIYSLDIAVINEALSYASKYFDAGVSPEEVSALYYDAIAACDDDGAIDEAEYDEMVRNHPLLSE